MQPLKPHKKSYKTIIKPEKVFINRKMCNGCKLYVKIETNEKRDDFPETNSAIAESRRVPK